MNGHQLDCLKQSVNNLQIMSDVFNLARFVTAQKQTYEIAIEEMRRGTKRTHWMWFIFPQIAGLGLSQMSQFFAIKSLAEARAYLRHPVLGSRLRYCVELLQTLPDKRADSIFGQVDAMKLHSSLTLFCEAGGGPIFVAALNRWFGGKKDPSTLERLGAS